MKHHPITKRFPPMPDDQYAALKASIQEIGQKVPGLTWKGQLIDGVNRERACKELGKEFSTEEWDGNGSLVMFVTALNKNRRHLTPDQCVHIAAELEDDFAKENKEKAREGNRKGGKKSGANRRGETKSVANLPPTSNGVENSKSREQAAAAMGVKPRRVQEAKQIESEAPELHEQVKNGEITHAQAKTELKRREKRAALAEQAAAVSSNGQPVPWEIRCGDCLSELARVEAATVRLAFADPPYNIGVDYGAGKKADLLARADYLAWCRAWMVGVVRTLTADGSFWALINDESAAEFKLGLEAAGLAVRQWLIWYETFGVNHQSGFNRSHRHLFWTVKDPKHFVFNADAVNRDSDRQTEYNDKRADPGGKNWDSVWGIKPPIPRLNATGDERLPDFPTQLPLALLRPIVGVASEPGDLVLDSFSGSGTAGVAAVEAGRRYVGIEKNKDYAAVSELRLKGVKLHA